jgi:hypothetical protein
VTRVGDERERVGEQAADQLAHEERARDHKRDAQASPIADAARVVMMVRVPVPAMIMIVIRRVRVPVMAVAEAHLF